MEMGQQNGQTGGQAKPEMPDLTSKAPDQGTLENFNLVPELQASQKGREWLEKAAKFVIDDFTTDLGQSEAYRDRCATDLELFLGRGDTMSGAAEGEPRPCLPMLSKIVLRIVARVLTMATTTEPIPVAANDEDHDRAERVGLHISWEKRAKHPDWASGMEATILQWCLFGSAFRYVGWDPLKNRKLIEPLSIADLVFPYHYKDHTLKMEDLPRYTRILRLPKHKILKLGKKGFFYKPQRLFTDEGGGLKARPIVMTDGEPSGDVIRKVIIEQEGLEPGSEAKGGSGVYALLERHSWEELPGQEEARRVAITVEKSTKKVLRVVIMERENKLDKIRFENEERQNQIAHDNAMAEYEGARQGLIEQEAEMGATVDFEAQLGAPPEMQVPDGPEMEPVFPIIHYKFWENPEGNLGLGVGVFVSQLNEMANNLMGENIVAERLANLISGIMSNDLNIEKGELSLEYGKFTAVDVPRGELEGAFMNFPFQRPKGNIMAIIDALDQNAQTVMSSSDYQSGMPGPSHETAAAAKIRNSEGARAIDAAMEMFLLPLSQEYRDYARLNATFMSDVEYFMVTEPDATNPGKQNKIRKSIGRADYDTDFDMTFTADARMALDPGVGMSAIQAYQLLMADPIAQMDKNLQLKALKKALKALKASDLAAMLPDSIPPPPPPSPMNQLDETAGFIKEEDHPVLPDDDHVNHLADMDEFESRGLYANLTPTGRQIYDKHKRGHQSEAYRQGAQIQAQERQAGNPMVEGNPFTDFPGAQ